MHMLKLGELDFPNLPQISFPLIYLIPFFSQILSYSEGSCRSSCPTASKRMLPEASIIVLVHLIDVLREQPPILVNLRLQSVVLGLQRLHLALRLHKLLVLVAGHLDSPPINLIAVLQAHIRFLLIHQLRVLHLHHAFEEFDDRIGRLRLKVVQCLVDERVGFRLTLASLQSLQHLF